MSKQTIKFTAWIGAMTLIQFHLFCGQLWDYGLHRFMRFDYWKGVRGYPGQDDVAVIFEEAKNVWVLKARQLGLSELAGEYGFKVAVTEPNSEILVISKDLADAKYFLKRRILPKIRAAYAMELPGGQKFPWPAYTDNTDTGKILFANGSVIEAMSSDNEQGRSRTPRLIILDEIRHFSHKDGAELLSGLMPAIQDNAQAQMICISTAKFGSWYNDITKKAMAGEMPDFTFVFVPADTRPERTAEWMARAKKNWAKSSMFDLEYPMKPEDCFQSREGAVFPTFDPKPGGRHVHEFDLSWAHKFIIGYDHGRQHPAVLLLMLYSKHDNHLYVFDELFCREMEVHEIGFAMRAKLNFYKDQMKAPPPQMRIADSACFAKDGRRTVADFLYEHSGIKFRAAIKHDILTRIDRLAVRFSQNTITIHPRCEQTRMKIENLRWKNDPTMSKKEEIVNLEDDSFDVLGYTDYEIKAAVKKTKNEVDRPFDPNKKRELERVRAAISSRGSSGYAAEDANAWQRG